LFAGSIGRTDLPTGNIKALRQSLRKLAALEVDYPIYPGHEESTTLFTEKRRNPFLRDA
jgi:glyoxylase-like metal-dependent hydrolase (beta-lactamase superfamily II)